MKSSCSDNQAELTEVPISAEQMEHLLTLQHEIFRKIATHYNHHDILADVCKSAESALPNAVASIMLYNSTKEHLKVIAAPSIPASAVEALNGIVPGEFSGSCGAAVFKDTPQFVCDTTSDPRWKGNAFQEFSANYNILACWSMPIKSETKSTIGSFALSSMEKRRPSHFHKKLLELCSDIVSIILQRQEEETKLVQLAHYDLLTQLPNRKLFIDRFNQAVAHAQRNNSMIAICFLDLDNFKPINDNYGHDKGDKLLIEVAERIKSTLREEDTASRQGGDEFTLLFRDIESFSECETTIARIHNELQKPYMIEGVSHTISASSGITLYPLDDGDIDTLIRHADHAMYEAKQLGRNQYSLFNPELDEKLMQQQHRLSEIATALDNRELQLYYQPKVNMSTGEVFGVEALIRWLHPERGTIPPLDFLPLIEGTALEIKVGNWVINQSLHQINSWNQQGIQVEVSINISSHHLLSKNFFLELSNALELHPTVNSKYLQLEILESTELGDIHAITTVIKSCQTNLGVSVALDDFGTGYSSLTHLRNLPANIIKIDQNFIRDLLDDPNDYVIVDGVIGLADSFNRNVIAEGVESTAHGLVLLSMGCENAQGYAIAKPMPADLFIQWLNDYIPNQAWLGYGNDNHTEKDNKLILFKLTSEQWLNHFIENTLSSPEQLEVWPIMNHRSCHCSHWIKRARNEQLFDTQVINKLEEAHKDLHSKAHELLVKYQQQKLDMGPHSSELTLLKSAFEKMWLTLGLKLP